MNMKHTGRFQVYNKNLDLRIFTTKAKTVRKESGHSELLAYKIGMFSTARLSIVCEVYTSIFTTVFLTKVITSLK